MNQYRILIQAPDRAGLVYKAAKIFYEHGLNIITNNEFVDNANRQFFMRTVVAGEIDASLLYDQLINEMPQDTMVIIKPPHKKISYLWLPKKLMF